MNNSNDFNDFSKVLLFSIFFSCQIDSNIVTCVLLFILQVKFVPNLILNDNV